MSEVLFVNPPSPDGHVYIRDINRSGRRSRERTIWPQTSLALLAAMLKRDGYSVDLLDCIATGMNWDEVKAHLKQDPPRYVVTNAITSIISNDLFTTYLGKFFGAITIAVGPHVTSLPQESLQRFPSLDFAIRGEAEETISDLIRACEAGSDLAEVPGIAYRDSTGKVVITRKRPLIENLDALPIPLHELLPISRYHLPFIGSNYTFVLASRGCPFQCTFCRQPIMWERQVRKRSAASIFSELQYLAGLGINNIMFHADTFTIDRDLVLELCDTITREGLSVRWICNSRVDTVDPEMLQAMQRAGCWMIAYGIETGSDLILKNVKKGGNATVAQSRQAMAWTVQAGIKIWAYFIIGLPGETQQTVAETIRFAKSIPADLVNFAVGAPYPGTELLDQAKAQRWLESDYWEDFDQNYSAILSYPDFSASQTLSSIQRAYKAWYLRPKGIYAFLKGIKGWEDALTLGRIAWDHLRIGRGN